MVSKNYSTKSQKIKCPNCIVSEVTFKFKSDNFQIYFCKKCLNGFTYPVPKNLGRYYSDNYWQSSGFIGVLKNTLYTFFQRRRKYWVKKFIQKGDILDVGSGEGIFSKLLKDELNVTSLDVPSSQIKNPEVIKVDFLKWTPSKKFDAVVFWESLEHTQNPQKYLKKASSILKKGGYVFIEYPRFDSWESRFFKKNWFHLDPPRHLSHLTPNGVNEILSREKLIPQTQFGVFAFEYTIGGFVESILNLFISRPNDFFRNSKNLSLIFLLIPLIIISTFLEIIFFILGQSPIYLTVGKKKI